MDTNKPIMMLDIDGVVNVFPDKFGMTKGLKRSVKNRYTIHMDPRIKERIAILKEEYTIVLFSLWNSEGPKWFAEDLGLEGLEYFETSWELGYDEGRAQGLSHREIKNLFYAKTVFLEYYLDKDQKWAWLDDMHSGYDRQYLVDRGFDPENFKLIRTKDTVGLSDRDVDVAVDFAKSEQKTVAWA